MSYTPSWPIGLFNNTQYNQEVDIDVDLNIGIGDYGSLPLDGIDDNCVRLYNGSAETIYVIRFELALLGYGGNIFAFDGGTSVPNGPYVPGGIADNIQDFGTPGPAQGILPAGYVRSGYEGPDNYFGDSVPFDVNASGYVYLHIPGGLPPGQETFFGTEAPLQPVDYVGVTVYSSSPPGPTTPLGNLPVVVGFPMVARGQLLRPNHGEDAGAHDGPAFAKKRRNHWFAMRLNRTQNINVGVDFGTSLKPIKLQTAGGTTISQPTLFSGAVTDTLADDYTFDGMISWEQRRPTPGHILKVGGFIQAQDK